MISSFGKSSQSFSIMDAGWPICSRLKPTIITLIGPFLTSCQGCVPRHLWMRSTSIVVVFPSWFPSTQHRDRESSSRIAFWTTVGRKVWSLHSAAPRVIDLAASTFTEPAPSDEPHGPEVLPPRDELVSL